MSSFQKISQDVVKDFLQTAFIIDDRIYSTEKKELPQELAEPVRNGVILPKSPETKVNKQEYSSDRKLETCELIAGFSQNNILCTPFQFNSETDIPVILSLSQKADIVILDWELEDRKGNHTLGLINSFVNESSISRLRLLCVYTGNPDLNKIAEQIREKLKQSPPASEDFKISVNGTIIVIYAKQKEHLNKENQWRYVKHNLLADKLIMDFSNAYSGLLRNAAMKAFTHIRSNTFSVLGKLYEGIDIPYLAHRAMIKDCEDAEPFAAELVFNLIHDVACTSDVSALLSKIYLEAWIDFKISEKNKDKCKRIISGIYKEQSITPKNVFELLDLKHDNIDNDCLHFTHLTSFSQDANPDYLRTGIALKDQDGSCFVCIQPECDCLRLEQGKEVEFAFLKMKPMEERKTNFNVSIQTAPSKYEKKLIEEKHSLTMFPFTVAESKGLKFIDGKIKSSNGRDFTVIGQMRPDHARRFLTQKIGHMSRLGLDEFEWIRKQSGSPRE